MFDSITFCFCWPSISRMNALSMNRLRKEKTPPCHCEERSDAAVYVRVAEKHGSPRWPSLRGAKRRGSRDDVWEIAGSWPVCSFRNRKQAARNDAAEIGRFVPGLSFVFSGLDLLVNRTNPWRNLSNSIHIKQKLPQGATTIRTLFVQCKGRK